ncbi:ornithine carbamoyltransferase [Akkermansia glycaniphila]|uniref:Ornithine carbamoyltransferase n=1 Tax=Akkermansia glycaniphila TaxID=1679444 RepID=A0A1H6KR93_9BACT|nr:ornithine carbamoyltransferase [Akkermansia glycaniphila]SEH78334.1 aspartate/ornithine carbamoyltransferase [Akkermansia glycaniphila]
MKNLLSIEELTAQQIRDLLALGHKLKAERGRHAELPLQGQTWALIFSKSSTRTRVSFEVGISELGGRPMFLSTRDIQLGRGEPISDTARVLGRMIHGAVIRTYEQQEVVDFANYSELPTINALTDAEHPCQILADLLTIEELYGVGSWKDMKIAFVGDGDNNMARSWMWAAKHLGFTLAIGAPAQYMPDEAFRRHLDTDRVIFSTDPVEAARNATVINTDTWISMGQESEKGTKEQHFLPYQVNRELLAHAASGHSVFHCLPAYRGMEITEEILEQFAPVIFTEAENRLHAQKAVLATLANNR